MPTLNKFAIDVKPDDFIRVYGRDGFYRVTEGWHRDPFRDLYYQGFLTLSDGSEIAVTDRDPVECVNY